MLKRRKLILKQFLFPLGDPQFLPRTPYKGMTDDELLSIEKFPLMLIDRCPFKAVFQVGEAQTVTLEGTVPNGFTYNCADIPFLCQPLSYDKHSPFVKNASFIHDYLCSRKRVLYEEWNLKEQGISGAEFRNMTSMIFCHVLKMNAVPYRKAQLMAFCVNLFQSLIYEWYTLDKTETTLWQ